MPMVDIVRPIRASRIDSIITKQTVISIDVRLTLKSNNRPESAKGHQRNKRSPIPTSRIPAAKAAASDGS